MEIIALYIAGVLVGILSSFFGVGGGILIVPLLYFMYPELPSSSVIAISLSTIFLTTFMNIIKYYRLGFFKDPKIIVFLILFCLMGGFTGSLLLPIIPSLWLKRFFGFFLLFISTKNLYEIYLKKSHSKMNNENPHPMGISIGAFIGANISSLTGLGGGVVFIPTFVNILGMNLTLASAFSNIGMSASTMMGVIPHLTSELTSQVPYQSFIFTHFVFGRVYFAIVGLLLFGATIGSKIGIKLNLTMEEKKKKTLLCAILYLVVIQIFFG
jgi:uncharacterized membrane protein YfcA